MIKTFIRHDQHEFYICAGQFKACLELASLVTDESTRNYAAFSTDKIKQILAKLR